MVKSKFKFRNLNELKEDEIIKTITQVDTCVGRVTSVKFNDGSKLNFYDDNEDTIVLKINFAYYVDYLISSKIKIKWATPRDINRLYRQLSKTQKKAGKHESK